MSEHPGLNGRKASDWLRQSWQQETRTYPNHSPRLANETHPEPYCSIKHIPSPPGGNLSASAPPSWQESRQSRRCMSYTILGFTYY